MDRAVYFDGFVPWVALITSNLSSTVTRPKRDSLSVYGTYDRMVLLDALWMRS